MCQTARAAARHEHDFPCCFNQAGFFSSAATEVGSDIFVIGGANSQACGLFGRPLREWVEHVRPKAHVGPVGGLFHSNITHTLALFPATRCGKDVILDKN